MRDVTIRTYRPEDGDALRALWLAAGFRLVGDDDAGLERFAARNPGGVLVAEAEGAIVASAMGAWDGRRGWLYHVATTPDRQGQGLATELVRRLEDHLRALGCERVVVLVETSNAAALAFWQHRGYETRPTRQLGKSLRERPPGA
jgi:ribosomal protein S18 acetylase RimI-like enzyme